MTSAFNVLRKSALAAWRVIPPGLRRAAAHAAITALAPRPTQTDLQTARTADAANAHGPWIVAGFLSSPSGLGQSARLAAKALQANGQQVAGIDLSAYFYEGSGEIAHGLPDGRYLTGTGRILLVVNAPYVPYALWLIGRRCVRSKRVIAYWAWEQPRVPQSWRRGLPYVHAVAVPSRFTADAIRAFAPNLAIGVAAHPIVLDPVAVRAQEDAAAGPFTVVSVLNVASGFERKNPLGLIAAFRLAFDDRLDCRLRLLITNAEHFAPARPAIEGAAGGAPNIEICWHSMSRPEFILWWGMPDVVASLHRSEGFGLTLAEAMLAGSAVMATGWSGNADFMNETTAALVRYRLVEIDDPQGKYAASEGQWAEPDVEHAADLLRRLKCDPAWRKRLGQAARTAVERRLSAEAFVAALDNLDPSNRKAHPAQRD